MTFEVYAFRQSRCHFRGERSPEEQFDDCGSGRRSRGGELLRYCLYK